jgi:hypothetical protein
MPWYVFNPGATDPLDPNNYGPPLITPPSCPGPKNFLCAIQANDDGSGHPIIPSSLCCELMYDLLNRSDSTNVKLRPTR